MEDATGGEFLNSWTEPFFLYVPGMPELTRQLYEAGELLGIQLVDSIVIGRDSYYSFEESGIMKMYKKRGRG